MTVTRTVINTSCVQSVAPNLPRLLVKHYSVRNATHVPVPFNRAIWARMGDGTYHCSGRGSPSQRFALDRTHAWKVYEKNLPRRIAHRVEIRRDGDKSHPRRFISWPGTTVLSPPCSYMTPV
ncbi:hypothetical protein GWI33_004254 [Rhynchophorus ferrugineus]|uniref:Uncharacterized protein n=1 Tax=Rhynchophorus ferrugineus TaxID=354439 RepID=A0A834MES0_RHYFE|nr:hypothetical protein GWI33_004254 [Rhynchophorus ferrugineus]